MTHDTLQVVNIVSKFQVPSSNGWDLCFSEDLEENDESIDESVNE